MSFSNSNEEAYYRAGRFLFIWYEEGDSYIPHLPHLICVTDDKSVSHGGEIMLSLYQEFFLHPRTRKLMSIAMGLEKKNCVAEESGILLGVDDVTDASIEVFKSKLREIGVVAMHSHIPSEHGDACEAKLGRDLRVSGESNEAVSSAIAEFRLERMTATRECVVIQLFQSHTQTGSYITPSSSLIQFAKEASRVCKDSSASDVPLKKDLSFVKGRVVHGN